MILICPISDQFHGPQKGTLPLDKFEPIGAILSSVNANSVPTMYRVSPKSVPSMYRVFCKNLKPLFAKSNIFRLGTL